jgi:hypothetical protein
VTGSSSRYRAPTVSAMLALTPLPATASAMLTTGKQVVLAAQKRAIVGARIEAPGVVYAYNTVKGITDIGSLVFLPLAGLKTKLP